MVHTKSAQCRFVMLATTSIMFFAPLLPKECAADQADNLTLWYIEPAKNWEEEALPIGNGRLGCMIFGDISKEHIQFNEDTLWIGDEKDTGAYQAFGDLYIEMTHQDAQSYRRQLDIAKAVHTITYKNDGINYTRQYFSSHPAGVMVFHFTADRKGAYTTTISLTDMHKGKIAVQGNRITSSGSLSGYKYEKNSRDYEIALDYEAQVLVLNKGGQMLAQGQNIKLDKVDSFTLLMAAGTDYLNQRDKGWKGEHPHKRITAQLATASKRPFDELLREHIDDYQKLFDRLVLDIGKTPATTLQLPTDQRLTEYKQKQADPDLEELIFQYARYLMISCSRPGCMPANLQGLWNRSNNPPWRSDYHTDVNIQMNYWFVDQANLSECFGPLAEWVNSIRQVRKEETKATFKTRGWLTHAENGVFGGSTWKWSKGDAAWVAQNLWSHYAFTLDKEYLQTRAYPVMKELCEFWEDHLKELPDGTLVSPDGFSPEHGPNEDGVSFDQQLVWDLFTNYIEASQVLGVDEEFRKKVASMKEHLLEPKIGKWGQLQEWMVDRDDPTDQHRHLSHLIAVHPGRQISPLTTPKLAQAARVSMNARGDGETGWSKAWKINIWARLHDGNHAYKLLCELIQEKICNNLYDTHPPFQIDGNFGYASGLCEMLLQSHMGQIHLLPALPQSWQQGYVKGIQARNGFELDIQWKEGELSGAVVRSEQGQTCRIRTTVPVTVQNRGKKIDLDSHEGGVITFQTKTHEEYSIIREGTQK